MYKVGVVSGGPRLPSSGAWWLVHLVDQSPNYLQVIVVILHYHWGLTRMSRGGSEKLSRIDETGPQSDADLGGVGFGPLVLTEGTQ